jgi:hypothetical protein
MAPLIKVVMDLDRTRNGSRLGEDLIPTVAIKVYIIQPLHVPYSLPMLDT